MSKYLAQVNIARLVKPFHDPQIKDFVDGLGPINRLAEGAEGFVWRLDLPVGAASPEPNPWANDPYVLVNMSVWRTVDDLKAFVFRSDHLDYLRRKAEWFEKPSEAHYVLWWVAEGHTPTLVEAHERLNHLRENGASAEAFNFMRLFDAPNS